MTKVVVGTNVKTFDEVRRVLAKMKIALNDAVDDAVSDLGTMSTQDADAVAISGGSISGITDLAIADGGTGASNEAGARTNLGLGTISTQDADGVAISGGSISGTDIDVSADTLSLAAKQIDSMKIGLSETDSNLVLKPDGAGGVVAGRDKNYNGWLDYLARIA